jgi:sulfite exporter TauE/SafE
MSDSRRLPELLLIGALAGLAVVGMVYLARALARGHGSANAAALIDDCRQRIALLQERVQARP